jgi:hypothetical protein
MRDMNAEAVRPDRVWVRLEQCGNLRFSVWGMEHGGLRSEVVEPVVQARQSVAGRAVAVSGIERDLRRGVGLV